MPSGDQRCWACGAINTTGGTFHAPNCAASPLAMPLQLAPTAPDPLLVLRLERLERLLLTAWPRCYNCSSLATHVTTWDGTTYSCEGHSGQVCARRMTEADDIEAIVDEGRLREEKR